MAEMQRKVGSFWLWVLIAIFSRLLLIRFPLKLDSRPEIATPLTSLRRLAEGYWLKQSSLSPYEGSLYHGSPLLLYLLGPASIDRTQGHFIISLLFTGTDFIAAMLIREIGKKLQAEYSSQLLSLNIAKARKFAGTVDSGDMASLLYLLNPLTLLTCVGSTTSPIENLMVILCLYGASTGVAPLAAFGWVIATHLSLYPAILLIPVILLLGYGTDTPPKKLFKYVPAGAHPHSQIEQTEKSHVQVHKFSWRAIVHFLVWATFWWIYVLFLCSISLARYGGLSEMFKKTYGFILTVSDLSPNAGVLWYFFAEVFDFFRVFFLMVFHANILFMMFPLAVRLYHRPCFLAFVYITISSMLKSYPSVGDSSLYLGLIGLFANELAEMRFSFMLVGGYIGVHLLSPVMHNLWIWRGTGNANFYFATALAYACFQTILIVESVSTMLNHDRKLKKQLQADAVK
ncbi:uncharacterized protein LOC116254960 [Nymphaea colorata]|nr:uncharacterized protein LOC116254960 [Nymphaea colorata]